MSNSGDSHLETPLPHIALFPAAGMGHLTPLLRLASMLATQGCHITVITPMPTVSAAESRHMEDFFSTHPNIHRLEFQVAGNNPSESINEDPFFRQWLSISRSSQILGPLIASRSPPITAIFSDSITGLCIDPIADDLKIPYYFVYASSARFVSVLANLPSKNLTPIEGKIIIPGLTPFPVSNIPPPVLSPNNLFINLTIPNAKLLPKAKGMLINTFDYFEYETITALRNGDVLSYLPPVFPVGPLKPCEFGIKDYPLWLDNQEDGTVVYVSFGSRTTMSREQIRELGDGLERSGFPFLWILKTSKVDKEDKGELIDLLGDAFFEKVGKRGIIVKGWVKQEHVLGHSAIGGFVSHCGWNSVTESTRHGIPVLAWPLHGDQKVNAEVVEKAGLGVWDRDWGWGGERLIKGDEIAEKIRKMMGDEKLKAQAKKIGEEARKALEVDGSSEKALSALISMVKQNFVI